MRKERAYWLLQLVGWSLYSILQFLIFSFDGQPIDGPLLIGEGLQLIANILLTHGFRYVIIRFRWLDFSIAKLIGLLILGVLILCGMGAFIWTLIVLIQNGADVFNLPFDSVVKAFAINMVESFFLFSFWIFAYFIYLYIERYNNSLKYEAAIRETELNNLKSQLNPHFIFNALNSIRALVDENPQKSKDAITQLSHILRNSLNSDRQKLVPFSDELGMVKDYLGLEAIRYEERLQAEFRISKESEQVPIPPLMVQTLVENGVKHGISKLKHGGKIVITSIVDKGMLNVEIRNTGQLADSSKSNKGFGIKNTRKRLKMIYGGQASFELSNENDETVLTQIKLPI